MKIRKKLVLFTASLVASTMIVAPMTEAATYVVKKGDTLTKIATSNETSVQHLKKWNSLNSDLIFVGQKLVVSNRSQTPKEARVNGEENQAESTQSLNLKNPATTSNSQVSQQADSTKVPGSSAPYKVVSGDTLSKIAKQHSVTVDEIKKWNNLQSDLIFVGQSLQLNKLSEDSALNVIGDPEEETFEPVIPPQILEIENQIKAQLASEFPVMVDPSQYGQDIYDKVVENAHTLLGTPYLYGGNTPEGFDCSGFVRYVYATSGLDIMRKSSNDYFLNETTIVETPIAGDVIFFKNTYISGISHMGIYLGNGEFIHAGNDGVEISNLSYSYWDTRFVAFKRFNQVE